MQCHFSCRPQVSEILYGKNTLSKKPIKWSRSVNKVEPYSGPIGAEWRRTVKMTVQTETDARSLIFISANPNPTNASQRLEWAGIWLSQYCKSFSSCCGHNGSATCTFLFVQSALFPQSGAICLENERQSRASGRPQDTITLFYFLSNCYENAVCFIYR